MKPLLANTHQRVLSCILLIVLAAAPVLAEEDASLLRSPWIQAEIIVFRQLDVTSAADESWPDQPLLAYPGKIEILRQPDDIPAPRQSPGSLDMAPAADAPGDSAQAPVAELPYIQLPTDQRLLNETAARISASQNYRLLQYQAWRQPLPGRRHRINILLNGGAAHEEHFELEGYVSILRTRFLHVEPRLWLNQFADPGIATTQLQSGPLLPPMPQPPPEPLPDTTLAAAGDSLTDDPSIPLADPEPLQPQPAPQVRSEHSWLLQEKRRTKLGEVHYFDHPMFGVIVSLRAYDPTEQEASNAEASAGLQPGN